MYDRGSSMGCGFDNRTDDALDDPDPTRCSSVAVEGKKVTRTAWISTVSSSSLANGLSGSITSSSKGLRKVDSSIDFNVAVDPVREVCADYTMIYRRVLTLR